MTECPARHWRVGSLASSPQRTWRGCWLSRHTLPRRTLSRWLHVNNTPSLLFYQLLSIAMLNFLISPTLSQNSGKKSQPGIEIKYTTKTQCCTEMHQPEKCTRKAEQIMLFLTVVWEDPEKQNTQLLSSIPSSLFKQKSPHLSQFMKTSVRHGE